MNDRLHLFLLLISCFLSAGCGAFGPASFERPQLASRTTSPDEGSSRLSRRGLLLVVAPPTNLQRHHRHGIELKMLSTPGDDDATLYPDDFSPAAVEHGRRNRRRGAPPSSLISSSSRFARTTLRALFGWVPSLSLSKMTGERPFSLSRVRGVAKRLVPALLLAFLIWHRSPTLVGGTPPPGGHQPTRSSRVVLAHATSRGGGGSSSHTSSRHAGNWLTRVIPRSASSSSPPSPRGRTTGSNKDVATHNPTSSSSTVVMETPSGGSGGERGTVRQSSSSSLASLVLTTTTTVATVGAGTTTTVVVLRRSKEARRVLVEKQRDLRRAFQSNLRRAVRHSLDVDDNLILAKRFRFLRAKGRDEGNEDEHDSAYDDFGMHEDAQLQSRGDGDAADPSSDAAASQSRRPSNYLLRKKSEQDYIQELLNRVKQNVAVPSMRRTERSVAARAAECHPHQDTQDGSSTNKQNGAAHSVVQSLKSISSLSTSGLDIDDPVNDCDDASLLDTPTVALGSAVAAPPVEVSSPTALNQMFLHDVDAAYALAFDTVESTSGSARYLHDVDEAYARAFEEAIRLPTVSLAEDPIQSINEGLTQTSATASLHEVDDAYAQAYLHASTLSPDHSSTEEPTVTMSGMSDLSLIGGEISPALWEGNLDDSDVVEMSDVVERFAAVEDVAVAPSTLETDAGLEQATKQDVDALGVVAVEDVAPKAPSKFTPSIRVIESLESLAESLDQGVASAAANVLTEVEAASDLADQLKMLRTSIDTTATTVDDEVDASATDASVESVTVDIPVGVTDVQNQDDLKPSDEHLDSGNPSLDVSLESSLPLPLQVHTDVPTDEAGTFDLEQSIDTSSTVASESFSLVDDLSAPPSIELETELESKKSVAPIASGLPTLPDEAVEATATFESIGTVPDPELLPMIPDKVETSPPTVVDIGGSSAADDADTVGTFPAWIRERVRSKRQNQRDRSRAKKAKQAHEVDSAKDARDFSTVVSSASTHVPHQETMDAISPAAVSEQLPIKPFASARTIKGKHSNAEHSQSIGIQSLRSGSTKKRRNKRVRQFPPNSAEAAALSRKYAAIPTLEERAFEILKDLGMLEPLEDSDAY